MRCANAWLVWLVKRYVEHARKRRDALEGRFVRRVLDNWNRAEQPDERRWFSWVKGSLVTFRVG